MSISIETDHPVSISTTRPVSITSEGGTTIVRIDSTVSHSGLASIPRAPDPVIESVLPNRHGRIMDRSGQPCARVEGHKGVCMNAEQVARKQAYNARRARERYQQDPEYRETVKAQSRESHARKKGDSAIE